MGNQGRPRADDLNIMVAGAAGQGIQTIGAILGKVFVRGGCEVFAVQDNESRIRGGHDFYQVRISRRKVRSAAFPLDLLMALTPESVELHRDETAPTGLILFDSEKTSFSQSDPRLLGLPLERLAVDEGGDKIFSNSAALGAAMALLGWEVERLEAFLREYFSDKADAAEGNAKAARAGHHHASKGAKRGLGKSLSPRESEPKMFINGHEAVALGALSAGCRFMTAYPMSPSTSIMMFLAGVADQFDMVVEQAEDEIAAVNMAIGASYAGIRSLTATSGGGFSLMAEGFGLAGATETPLVVVEAQRPGPATGLPTRTEQADLLFALHASQGEFPRVVFAPGTPRQAFHQTVRAFDLAYRYQVPVVLLTDQYLADSVFTEERFSLSDVKIRPGLISEDEAKVLNAYRRYEITPSGVSPRAVPGFCSCEVAADSHEHDENGHITEDAHVREQMVRKRFRKLSRIREEMDGPAQMGDQKSDLVLVGWGSTYGPLAEAVEMLNQEGVKVKGVHLSELSPFPAQQMARALEGVKRWAVAENNFTGQLGRLIQMEIQKKPDANLLKFTGRPFTAQEIAEGFKKEVVGR